MGESVETRVERRARLGYDPIDAITYLAEIDEAIAGRKCVVANIERELATEQRRLETLVLQADTLRSRLLADGVLAE